MHGAVRAAGAGGMALRIAGFDWSGTALGPRTGWPPHLRASVDLMLAHGFPMIVLWGPDLVQLYNDGYAQILADRHPGGLGQATAACWPEVWHINGPIYERVWRGETVTFQDKLYPLARRGRLEDVWFTISYSPLRDDDGGIDGVLVTMFETTTVHAARASRDREQARRRDSERRLALLFKVLPVGVCLIGTDGQVQMSNDRMRTYLPSNRVPSNDPDNAVRWQGWHADGSPVQPADFAAARALRGETVVPGMDFLFTHEDGQARWTRVAAAPLHDGQGGINGAFSIVMDIDALKRATERQAVLLAELQHRVRNIMAVINAIAVRTRDSATTVDDYAERLSGRLMSLARTQALLTRTANAGVCLRGMLEEELAAQAHDASQYQLEGEDVLLPPKAAEVLSLAVHELGTNALKHGALSVAGGQVHVAWRLARRTGGECWLELHWQERHPPLEGWVAPQRKGLGRALIEQRVPYELAGTGRLRFAADGTEAWIRFPLRDRDSLLQTDAPES
ncbi:PAS domain-containing sensor histidine kinase [Stenotrophomonas sp. 24(2023)]|uniref:sensor histidine kinase n=1 Tax=Stenotrophomonas sp. 24(2023) TaxID=3068324 RepID=UPI0027E1FFB1|nr:PAS domain-containing sensor histidine kinase [Stenotrophomonas sp. 24(2023)]WMJ71532.1 HWE histidine kinase domain-containing protein [Stenotrophomonas sp. 24(2023)]